MKKGEVVSNKAKGITRSFGGKNQGPFIVTKVIGPSVYELGTENGQLIGRFPIKLLIPYRQPREGEEVDE